MTGPLDPALLPRLKKKGAELNAQSDAFNAVVKRVDEALKPLNIGVECWVPTVSIGPEPLELGYAHWPNRWGLGLRRGTDSWPFVHGPRAYRIAAIAYLPALIELLTAQVDALMGELVQATATAQAFVKEIETIQERRKE